MKNLLPAFLLLPFFAATQNVGIGTTAPTRARLELYGSVGATSAIFGGETSGVSLQSNWPGVGFNSYYNAGDRYLASGFGAKIYLDPNSGYLVTDMYPLGSVNAAAASYKRAIVIAPSGNIGIGPVVPNGLLQFPNTLNNRKIVLYESANNDHQFYGLGIEGGTLRYAVDGTGGAHRFYAGNGTSSSLLLMTIAGTQKVIIGTQGGNGKLGINSADPQYPLEIVETNNGLFSRGLVLIDALNGYVNWEIASSVPVGGGTPFLGMRYNDNARVSISSTNGAYTSISDSRAKKNIEPINSVLDKLMQLKPVRYNMKDDLATDQPSLGFIAQEVRSQFPELVSVRRDMKKDGTEIPDLHLLNYSGFGVIAIRAIQEQQKEIEDLKQQNQHLAKRLEALEKQRL